MGLKNKKITLFIYFVIIILGFSQPVFAIEKNLGEVTNINVSCSDSNGNLSECNITSPVFKNCFVSGFSGFCSGTFTCVESGTFDICGFAKDAQGLTDSDCLNSITCNAPPDKPYPTSEYLYHCVFKSTSVPTFYWTYSDPNGDPQGGYELMIDHDEGFNDPFSISSPLASTSLRPNVNDWKVFLGDWTFKNYWWKVRVKDSKGAWSEWSTANKFVLPDHPYPYPDFTYLPSSPFQGEAVLFNSESTLVYGGATISEYLWTVSEGVGEFSSSTDSSSQNPEIVFSSLNNAVTLEVTDSDGYSCQSNSKSVITEIPLPEYHESSPGAWIKNIFGKFNRILSVFSFKY